MKLPSAKVNLNESASDAVKGSWVTPGRIIGWAAVVLCILAGFAAAGIPEQAPKTVKRTNASPPASMKGADLYMQYCAACHGEDGKGSGPAAAAMKKAPTDVTLMSKQNGGTYPALHMKRIIQGDDVLAAHGSRDMPIWSTVFHATSGAAQPLIVQALVSYIEQLQVK